MRGAVLVDSGPLLALMDADEATHSACLDTFGSCGSRKLVTCWPVLTEVAYFLVDRRKFDLLKALLKSADGTFLTILSLDASDLPSLVSILHRYQGQELQLADLALMHLAERDQLEQIFTLDRRHFDLYRPQVGNPPRILGSGDRL
jgi:uncharacterized protein